MRSIERPRQLYIENIKMLQRLLYVEPPRACSPLGVANGKQAKTKVKDVPDTTLKGNDTSQTSEQEQCRNRDTLKKRFKGGQAHVL